MIDRVAMGIFGQEFPVEAGTLKTHDADQCMNDAYCVIHKPSNHKMREWPITLRMDKLALAERRCKHNVGHPDPDSISYIVKVRPSSAEWIGVHGCDGCCAEDYL